MQTLQLNTQGTAVTLQPVDDQNPFFWASNKAYGLEDASPSNAFSVGIKSKAKKNQGK